MTKHWLLKSEPEVYPISSLRRDGTTSWDGVRNFQARNLIRDEMKVGDLVLFYHSNADPPGVAGIARVAREGHPDVTAFDKGDHHFDPKSDPANPTWYVVDVAFVEQWADVVGLPELKADPALDGMMVTRKGSSLSVQPVEAAHFERIVALGRARGPIAR